jgi:hypothetical protein
MLLKNENMAWTHQSQVTAAEEAEPVHALQIWLHKFGL